MDKNWNYEDDAPCKIHEMQWCAVCNGDAKKFEETQKPDWDEILFEGLHGRNK